MQTHRPCTFRTFWLGYRSWLTERAQKTWPEVAAEVNKEHGRAWPIRLAWLLISLVFFMIVIVALLPDVARHSAAAGLTSNGLMQAVGTATYLLLFGLLGLWLVRRYQRLRHFCHQMCERGYRILEERGQLP